MWFHSLSNLNRSYLYLLLYSENREQKVCHCACSKHKCIYSGCFSSWFETSKTKIYVHVHLPYLTAFEKYNTDIDLQINNA